MRPEDKDAAYLWDMRTAAREVLEFTRQTDVQGYLKDRKLQMAVERAVEIIGEAARKVSSSFQEKHPEIPWRGIIAQRHVLAHEYGEIKQERMWTLVSVRIPELVANLEPLIPPQA
jgi:uncharacterized protein with HEPN domain